MREVQEDGLGSRAYVLGCHEGVIAVWSTDVVMLGRAASVAIDLLNVRD